jgi:chromate transport protein ChrA
MKKSRLFILLTTVAALLLIPLIAMQFTDEVNWDLADFMVAAVLLLVAVFTYELISRKVKAPTNRTILSVTLLIIFLLIWAELAVGIFGTPFAGS